ncbi:MAG TPA: hypothetical protein VHH09_01995 [Acidimicrobiales bacterium]|nr:hypothetical protein [Acidimicrobiales bacterium]
MDEDEGSSAASEHMVGLATALLDDDVLHDLLQGLTVLANHAVGSAHSVSITVAENGQYRTSSSTGQDAVAIDEAQYRDDDGPCLEALRSTRQVRVAVGERDGRWPQFDAEAKRLGVTDVLSILRGSAFPSLQLGRARSPGVPCWNSHGGRSSGG